jgi:xanthine dehydrogenase YagR molybdenum-binding subunit
VPNAAYGYIVGAAIAKGRIESIDLTAAKQAPGVIGVVTRPMPASWARAQFNAARLLAGPDVDHYHQAVALVVAETFEQARAAAQLVRVRYARAKGAFDLAAAKDSAVAPEGFSYIPPPETRVGDFAGAFANAPVKLDATYTRPTSRTR